PYENRKSRRISLPDESDRLPSTTESNLGVGRHFKFVNRKTQRTELFEIIVGQFELWKRMQSGKPFDLGKELKFATVIGTSGIGKTTFLRRSIELLAAGTSFSVQGTDC